VSDDLQNLIERYKRGPDSRLFAPLADAYRKEGDVDKAIEILEKGLKRLPQYASAHVILGKCYYDKGATERAKGEFRRVLELDGENMVALKFMGDILLAEDRRPEASEYYRRILVVDPMNEEVARTLKEMEASFVGKEIDLHDAKAVRDERPRELATMTLAGIYAAQGYYNKALRIYSEVLEREPGNREAKEMVAKLESIMNSSEVERDKAFHDDVLTISLNDISDDIASSTAGHGGAEIPVRDDAASGHAPAPGPIEGAPTEGAVSEKGPEAPASPEPEALPRLAADAPEKEPAVGDMEHFRDWLKKLKGK